MLMRQFRPRRRRGRPISILLVDDDVELCELLEEFFDQHGFRIESVHDGRRGLARALCRRP